MLLILAYCYIYIEIFPVENFICYCDKPKLIVHGMSVYELTNKFNPKNIENV